MSSPATPSSEYVRNAVLTATPEQLQLMLYDGAIKHAARARDAVGAKDREGAFNAMERAQRIVLELSNGLRREVNPALADQMAALYSFIYRRLIDANIHQDVEALDDALRILRQQRETWVLLMEKLRQETHGQGPAPGQSVPAGQSGEPTTRFVAEG